MPTIEGEDLRVHAERPLVQTEGPGVVRYTADLHRSAHIIPEVVDSRDTDPEVVAHEAEAIPYCSVWICQALKPS